MTRSKEDIGRGLAPARAGLPIPGGQRIHVIGAAGAGASAAALLAARAGAEVNGCDPGAPSPYTAALEAAGVAVVDRHATEHLSTPAAAGRPIERLAVTKALTAVDPDHPELRAARDLGIPIEAWQQLVADACATSGQRLVAVAGTHGKSTTAGWLVHLLVTAGRDPSAFVGALLEPELSGGPPSTARWGAGPEFVVEADEYAGNFDPYRPAVTLLLNAEWDHPDVFADREAVIDAFAAWLRRAAETVAEPTLVANVADEGARAVVDRLAGWPGRVVTVGLNVQADVSGQIDEIEGQPALVVNGRFGPGVFTVGLPGAHNMANAMMVIAAHAVLGLPRGALDSIADYRGVSRRMELAGEVGGVTVLDDYAHHPTAIARTLEAVRQRYPGRRVWAVYEPLTYHRTAAMLEEFAAALAAADAVAVADIWAGRDPDTTITSSPALAAAVTARGGPSASAPGSVEATADHLAAAVQPGDVVLVMGGGRSYVIAHRLVDLLRGKAG